MFHETLTEFNMFDPKMCGWYAIKTQQQTKPNQKCGFCNEKKKNKKTLPNQTWLIWKLKPKSNFL